LGKPKHELQTNSVYTLCLLKYWNQITHCLQEVKCLHEKENPCHPCHGWKVQL